jgi:spoIIIJ-associated protein
MPESSPAEPPSTQPKYTVDSLGSQIEDFLDLILDDADFDLEYEIEPGDSSNPEIENPEVVVKFTGPDVDLLLSNKAELLLALEHITMEALKMPSEDHSRLSFDANDYRSLRIAEIRLSANAAAEKVKHTGEPFRFNPMNSRERRVIHIALRHETELRSESAGFGGHRHVIVYPAGMASLPEPPPPPPHEHKRHDRRPFDSSRPGGPRRGPGGRDGRRPNRPRDSR